MKPTFYLLIQLQSHSSRAWYASGSWPRVQKASPSTQVARETILADKPKNAPNSVDFSRFEPKKTDATSASASGSLPPSTDPGEIKEGQELILADTGAEAQGVTVPEADTDKHSNITNGSSNPSKPDPGEAQRPNHGFWMAGMVRTHKSGTKSCRMSCRQSQILSGGNEASPGNPIKQQSPQAR